MKLLPLTDETRLLQEARQAQPELGLDALTRDKLCELTAKHGVDWATALFYDRISAAHADFMGDVDAQHIDLSALPQLPYTLVVAPAAGYLERPEFGGDGALIQAVAQHFGLPIVMAPLLSLGPVRENVAILRDLLATYPARSVILLSVSKGGTESRLVMADPGAHVDAIAAWLNVGGVLRGTPVVDQLMASWRARAVLRTLMLARKIHRKFIEDFQFDAPLLGGPIVVPPGFPVINLLGFPLASHMAGTIGKRHTYLSVRGPNDGYTLLTDAIAPGHVYPVWGASHYMRLPRLSDLLYRVFSWLSQQLVASPSDPP